MFWGPSKQDAVPTLKDVTVVGEADAYVKGRKESTMPGGPCRVRQWPGECLMREGKATRIDNENCPGIPSPSCQPGNTEQSNVIGRGKLSLAWSDQGLGVSE